MGPKNITERLEYFYKNILSRFNFSGLTGSTNEKNSDKKVILTVSSERLPSMYILIEGNGPYLIGLSPKNKIIKDKYFKEVPVISQIFQTYSSIFSGYTRRKLNIKETYSHMATLKNIPDYDSFCIVGEDTYLKRKMISEDIIDKKKISVSGFFSEDLFRTLIGSYETWNENGYRFDFTGDESFFSIKCSKDGFENKDPLEIKAIGEFYSAVLSGWLPGLLEASRRKFEIPGISNALSTFSIKFDKLPLWILKLHEFKNFYEESVYSISDYLNNDLKKKLEMLGGLLYE